MNDIKEFWNARVEKYSHTGWSNSFIYAYDQQARLTAVEKILNSLSFNTLSAKNDFWGENRPGPSPLKIMIFRKVK